MNGGKLPLGYTIVEVLIVLAVSGLLFVIAANFISGKQERATFTQGSNELVSRLQTIIGSVTDGQYTDIPLTCDATGSQVKFTSTGLPQGTNSPCVFLGKLLHFTAKPGDSTKYEVFSLAGARAQSGGEPITTLLDTKLSPIIGTGIDLTIEAVIPQNLEVTAMRVTDASGTNTGKFAFGFIQGLGSSKTLGDGTVVYQSGYQNVRLVYNDHAAMLGDASDTIPTGAAAIGQVTAGTVKFAQSADICISNGIRTAMISIGADNDSQSQLHVTIKQLGEEPVTCP